MRQGLRLLLGAALLLAGAVFALYGVFAILYEGDGRGTTYVRVNGTEVGADLVGATALAIALLFLLVSRSFLRRPKAHTLVRP